MKPANIKTYALVSDERARSTSMEERANNDGYETVDIDVPELESILTGGGWGENGCDVRHLAGVEVRQDTTKPAGAGG